MRISTKDILKIMRIPTSKNAKNLNYGITLYCGVTGVAGWMRIPTMEISEICTHT